MDVISKDLLKQFVYMDSKVNLYAPDGSFEIPLSMTAAKLYSPVIKTALESPLSVSNGDQKDDSYESRITRSIAGSQGKKESKQVTSQLSGGNLRRIKVDEFDGKTVQIFIRCLQGQIDDTEVKSFDWKCVMEILKMFHFYEVDHMYDIFLKQAIQLMSNELIVEAVHFMEIYGFQESWCTRMVDLLYNNPATFNTQEWKDSILKCPHTQSRLQAFYIKRKLGYG
uniref:BTB domain-containing protein n=1 Tax=Clytia hemisphaerica TaxID=252671 RepID=A0A7M5VBN3_9CNID|eukprot:TCONS_00073157-protein